jgi:hypothetical protein
MKHQSRRLLAGAAVALGGLILSTAPAGAWTADLSASGVVCHEDTGQQEATFQLHNPEHETLTVTQSSAGVFAVGVTVVAGGEQTAVVQRDGDFSGTVTETLHVSWPSDDGIDVTASVTFPGNCSSSTPSTPTTSPTTPTTSPDSSVDSNVDEDEASVAGVTAQRNVSAPAASVQGSQLSRTAAQPRFTG